MTKDAASAATEWHDVILETVWHELVDIGPRFMGTDGAQKAVDVILDHVKALGLDPQIHEFDYQGWSPGKKVALFIDGQPQEAYAMLGSHCGELGKPKRGTVRYMGPFAIWDRLDWERFALVGEDGSLQAYLMGRREGPAIPQALPEGIDHGIPYVAISSETVHQLFEAEVRRGATGCAVSCEVQMDSGPLASCSGVNIAVNLPARGKRRVLIGAHYDSLYSTPGAYDNAAGAACLMALAHQFIDGVDGLDIQLVWFGAEEWLLRGSHAYVETLEQEKRLPDFMLNLDGMGRGDTLEVWYGPDRWLPRLDRILEPIARELGIDLKYIFPAPPGSDHAPFYDRGIPVCMLTFNDGEILHRPEDVIEDSKLNNMRRAVKMASALILDQAKG